MSHLDLAFSIITFVLEGTLVSTLFYRKLVGKFRLFFAFLVCTTAADIVRFWLIADTRTYYLLYWASQALCTAVALAVMIDIFRDVVQLVYRRFGALGFLLPLILFALTDVLFWLLHRHSFGRNWLGVAASVVYSFELGISLLETGISLLCLWIRQRYRILGRHRLSVLAGFGLIGASTMIAYVVRIGFGARFDDVFRYIPPFAFMCATLIWIIIFSLPEPEEDRRRPDLERIERFLEFANRYVEEARETMRRWGLRVSPV